MQGIADFVFCCRCTFDGVMLNLIRSVLHHKDPQMNGNSIACRTRCMMERINSILFNVVCDSCEVS